MGLGSLVGPESVVVAEIVTRVCEVVVEVESTLSSLLVSFATHHGHKRKRTPARILQGLVEREIRSPPRWGSIQSLYNRCPQYSSLPLIVSNGSKVNLSIAYFRQGNKSPHLKG